MKSQENILDEIRNITRDILPGKSHVFLYGSRARGTATKESDWDILIVLDKSRIEQSDYDEFSYPITALGWKMGETIVPVLYTKNEWEKIHFTTFYKNVEKDKILIS